MHEYVQEKKKLLFQVLESLPVVLLVSTANNEAATEYMETYSTW